MGTPEYVQLSDLEKITTKFGQLKSPEHKRLKVSGLFSGQEQLCHNSIPTWHNPNLAVSETGTYHPPTNNPSMISSSAHPKMLPGNDVHASGQIGPHTTS